MTLETERKTLFQNSQHCVTSQKTQTSKCKWTKLLVWWICVYWCTM